MLIAGAYADEKQEIQQQNEELRAALEELQARQAEVDRLNRELEETNRGVVALYAELDEKAHHLQRASELKSRFLSNMTHEFRTPLNSILSLSRLLLDRTDGELTQEQEKQVRFVRKSAEDLSELVNDLLDLAKIEAGRTVVRPSQFEVAELLGALRGVFRPLLTSDAVSLMFDEPMDIPALRTDEGKVAQILRNFISNALKFTEQGEVRVSTAMGPNDTIIFSVRDTGIGIAPADQERIFEEFTQLDAPIQQRVKGTGLGLPLTKKLAALLGGSVSVESELGVGTTFFAAIPRVYAGLGEDRQPSAVTMLDPARSPILVVEDDPDTMALYEQYLNGSGFQVISARSVGEARARLAEVRPVGVVLDILLEGRETSFPLLAELKASEVTRDIPILVVTVIDGQPAAMALGADDFCLKPVERWWLLDRLNRLIKEEDLGKVLIIDDDEVSRYLLKSLLADTGTILTEAANGREGIKRAREEAPRVIFLDLVMPDLTGFEVLEHLKSDPLTRDIPIIINSSKHLDEEERRRLTAQASAILSKENPSREAAVAMVREALKTAVSH